MREETRHELQSIRDDINKLSASVDERVSRHINSTKEQHNLRREIRTELNVAKQEISTFMQDVNKSNREVRDSFCQSELANAQKFPELDREVAELREKISRGTRTVQADSDCDSESRCKECPLFNSAGAYSGGRLWRFDADSRSQTVYRNDFLIPVNRLTPTVTL